MENRASYFSPLSSPSSHPSPDSTNRNLSSVINSLPLDLKSYTSILSIKEKESLAYLIKLKISDTQSPNSKKRPILTPHDPSFNCLCSDCDSRFREIFHNSDKYDHMHLILEEAIDLKNKKKQNKNKKRRKNQEQRRVQEIHQNGSSGNGGVGLENAGSKVIQPPTLEKAVANWPQMERSNHMGFGWKLLPDLLGISNSRWWILWNPIVQEENEENY